MLTALEPRERRINRCPGLQLSGVCNINHKQASFPAFETVKCGGLHSRISQPESHFAAAFLTLIVRISVSDINPERIVRGQLFDDVTAVVDTIAEEDDISIGETVPASFSMHGEDGTYTTFHGILLVTLDPTYRTFVELEASLIHFGEIAGLVR